MPYKVYALPFAGGYSQHLAPSPQPLKSNLSSAFKSAKMLRWLLVVAASLSLLLAGDVGAAGAPAASPVPGLASRVPNPVAADAPVRYEASHPAMGTLYTIVA